MFRTSKYDQIYSQTCGNCINPKIDVMVQFNPVDECCINSFNIAEHRKQRAFRKKDLEKNKYGIFYNSSRRTK